MKKPHLLNFHFWPFRQKPFLQISIGLLLCKLNSKISLSLLLFFRIDKTSIPPFLKLSLVYAISMIGCKGCFSSEAGFLVPESLAFVHHGMPNVPIFNFILKLLHCSYLMENTSVCLKLVNASSSGLAFCCTVSVSGLQRC